MDVSVRAARPDRVVSAAAEPCLRLVPVATAVTEDSQRAGVEGSRRWTKWVGAGRLREPALRARVGGIPFAGAMDLRGAFRSVRAARRRGLVRAGASRGVGRRRGLRSRCRGFLGVARLAAGVRGQMATRG